MDDVARSPDPAHASPDAPSAADEWGDDAPAVAPLATWRDRVGAVADRVAGPERRWGRVAAGAALAVGALVAALALLRPPAPPPPDAALPYTTGVVAPGAPGAAGGGGVPAPPSSTTTAPEAPIVVHAAGAVAVGGLHELAPGARVADLLAAAGGPSADADLDRLNLAAPLTDGQRVWVPRAGEDVPPPVVGPDGGAPTGEPGDGAPGPGGPPSPVDVNTATADELDTLPGVGPATAAAIIEHRERVGPFRVVEDLLQVSGIGDAKLAQLRDFVVL